MKWTLFLNHRDVIHKTTVHTTVAMSVKGNLPASVHSHDSKHELQIRKVELNFRHDNSSRVKMTRNSSTACIVVKVYCPWQGCYWLWLTLHRPANQTVISHQSALLPARPADSVTCIRSAENITQHRVADTAVVTKLTLSLKETLAW